MISGAKEQFKKKSEERRANGQNQILSGWLVSEIRRKDGMNSESDFKDRTVIMVEKHIKRHDLYIF